MSSEQLGSSCNKQFRFVILLGATASLREFIKYSETYT